MIQIMQSKCGESERWTTEDKRNRRFEQKHCLLATGQPMSKSKENIWRVSFCTHFLSMNDFGDAFGLIRMTFLAADHCDLHAEI